MSSVLHSSRLKRSASLPSSRRKELCYCTEELGSESASSSMWSLPVAGAKPFQKSLVLHASCDRAGEENAASVKGGMDIGIRAGHVTPCRSRSMSAHARTFPPPISSLLSDRPLLRSFKLNGRFVLKKIDNASSSPFCAVRENGRLRLILASSSSDGHEADSSWKDAETGIDEGFTSDRTDIEPIRSTTAEVQDLTTKKELAIFKEKWSCFGLQIPKHCKGLDAATQECLTKLKFLLMAQKLNQLSSVYGRRKEKKFHCKFGGCTAAIADFKGPRNTVFPADLSTSIGFRALSSSKQQGGYAIIISISFGLMYLLLEYSCVGFIVKGVYLYKYAHALNPEVLEYYHGSFHKDRNECHEIAAPYFSPIREKSFLMPLYNVEKTINAFHLVKNIDYRIAA